MATLWIILAGMRSLVSAAAIDAERTSETAENGRERIHPRFGLGFKSDSLHRFSKEDFEGAGQVLAVVVAVEVAVAMAKSGGRKRDAAATAAPAGKEARGGKQAASDSDGDVSELHVAKRVNRFKFQTFAKRLEKVRGGACTSGGTAAARQAALWRWVLAPGAMARGGVRRIQSSAGPAVR